MDTFELERMCRLCGKQLHNTIGINIFKNKENYEKKIHTLLPIMIHEMDCLPKYLCYDCSDKLQQLYDFYIQTLKFDLQIKNQLSWMKNEPVVKSDIIPTVYFADLRSLKIKSEIENLNKLYASQGEANFNSIPSSNAGCSMEKTHDDINNDELNSLPMSVTNNVSQQTYKDKDNQLPSNETIPLACSNDDLQSDNTVETLNSKINFSNTMKQEKKRNYKKHVIPRTIFLHNDTINNNTTTTTNNTSTDNKNINDSYNCHEALAKVLIKRETKENNEFIRKLRPRGKIFNVKSFTKIAKNRNKNKSSPISRDYKPTKLMSDSKLSKKVEIKVEKLECVENAAININSNESKNIINNYSSNMQCTMRKPKHEIADDIMEKIKPLRTQNNLKDIASYESKVELHIKGSIVKLTKINISQLKKPVNIRKLRNKISNMTKTKKIHDAYVCERCNELFTKRELYRLHFCYLH